ncbi:MAG: tellurite resistance/C4-dicarboxylate transporter family protein, partial [Dermatophilaceae bacterium]
MSPTDRAQPPASARGDWARHAVQTLNPGYFALVMATGIVSIAVNNAHYDSISVTLLWLAGIAYVVLVAVYLCRLIYFRAALLADLSDPSRAFGFFTFVAATDVLGARLATDQHHGVALALLAVGSLSWLVFGYLIPWTVMLGTPHRPVIRYANGTWFIWVVASQSIAVLAATLESALSDGRRELALLAVFSWSVGVFLYAAAGTFVAIRLLLYPVPPAELAPAYWVSMGATAITVVAGARIVQMADAPMVDATRGLIAGTSVVFWAFGTWLIPALIAAGIWRHIVHRVRLRYEPALWSVVFPLGMYGVGAHYLGQADHLPIVEAIGAFETWVGLAAWTVTFAAMLAHLSRSFIRPPATTPPPATATPATAT